MQSTNYQKLLKPVLQPREEQMFVPELGAYVCKSTLVINDLISFKRFWLLTAATFNADVDLSGSTVGLQLLHL